MMRAPAFGPYLAAALLAVSGPALADATSDQCVDSNRRAQSLRRSGKLISAREELQSCAASRCPRMVRDDCTERLDEVNRAQPTLVFDARDATGKDIVDVAVTVDGRPLAAKLDGRPLSVDPGLHSFEFAVGDQATVRRSLVLKEGEKARIEHLVLGPSPAPPPPPADAAPELRDVGVPPRGAAATGATGGKVVGVLVGTLGIAGLATGAVYGILAQSWWKQATTLCDTASCPGSSRPQAEADRRTAVSDGTYATIGLVAGGVLLAAGVTIFVASPSGGRSPEHGVLYVSPAMGPSTAGLNLRGEF